MRTAQGFSLALGAALLSLAVSACLAREEPGPGSRPRNLAAVPSEDLERLMKASVFFGHQSVGYNLIDGAAMVLGEEGVHGFAPRETRQQQEATGPSFYHARIGTNGDPIGKIRDFESIMRSGMAARVDLALMKLCFVDITESTDTDSVFAAYEATMTRLQADYPELVFAWTTVPLTTVERGPKAAVKRLIGRPLEGSADNLARERYNRMVREKRPAGAPLVDLALFESTSAMGAPRVLRYEGHTYHALIDEYSTDGGHLGVEGQRIVAGRFIAALVDALPKK